MKRDPTRAELQQLGIQRHAEIYLCHVCGAADFPTRQALIEHQAHAHTRGDVENLIAEANGQPNEVLPLWARQQIHRAVEYIHRDTDDVYVAAQRADAPRKKRRLKLLHRWRKRIEKEMQTLSLADQEDVGYLLKAFKTIERAWTPRPKKKGRPAAAVADRDQILDEVVTRLEEQADWDSETAWNRILSYIVETYPADHPQTHQPVNQHLYGPLSSGYLSRWDQPDPRQRRESWDSLPLKVRAFIVLKTRLRTSRTNKRNTRSRRNK